MQVSTSRKLTKGQFFASCILKWASSEIYFVNFHSRLFFFLHFYWSILDLQYLLVSVAPQNQLRCLVPRSCPTLCGPHDCSPPGSSVRGICQARILKWIVISSPGDLPDPRIKPVYPAFAGGFFTTEPPGKPELYINKYPHFFSIFSYRSFTEYWVELLGPCSRSLLVTTATHTHTHTQFWVTSYGKTWTNILTNPMAVCIRQSQNPSLYLFHSRLFLTSTLYPAVPSLSCIVAPFLNAWSSSFYLLIPVK